LPIALNIMVSDSGMIAVSAYAPRNLSVTGRSLQEAFNALIEFASDCEAMGKPFDVLNGVRLKGDGKS
jgi:hypothetical protein